MNTLKDLLNIAIQGEINSQKLYQRGVEVAGNEEIKKFFEQLVKEETNHENLLFNMRETGLYDMDIEIDDPQLFEAARTSHGANVAFDENWTTEDILATAMKREFTAMNRYKAAALVAKDPELITLLNNLSAEESNHHRTIEQQYNRIKGKNVKEF